MENEKELSFEDLYNQSLKESKLEKTVTGKIISITQTGEIFVDIHLMELYQKKNIVMMKMLILKMSLK